jgi:hypothetical protein
MLVFLAPGTLYSLTVYAHIMSAAKKTIFRVMINTGLQHRNREVIAYLDTYSQCVKTICDIGRSPVLGGFGAGVSLE